MDVLVLESSDLLGPLRHAYSVHTSVPLFSRPTEHAENRVSHGRPVPYLQSQTLRGGGAGARSRK